MPGDHTTRWTVTMSQGTVEDAGRWRAFDQTLAGTREPFADLDPDARQALIDEATAAVRNTTRETLARAAKKAP
jgi:hypothetical protein